MAPMMQFGQAKERRTIKAGRQTKRGGSFDPKHFLICILQYRKLQKWRKTDLQWLLPWHKTIGDTMESFNTCLHFYFDLGIGIGLDGAGSNSSSSMSARDSLHVEVVVGLFSVLAFVEVEVELTTALLFELEVLAG